ncbi:uncharacterized protein LOC125666100 isoform X2 [Ostrea edulis]|uniref:uncharacterized protein LOC125666100 isoform X2 n=1 Tax=Ostrea edulis TaxID=37623 RepID=UPI0024AFA153|nr:uncharacterized protein LOC125666100 isoform X2 [Ostrea edulis]
MERRLRICFYLGLLLMLGCADEILLRAAKTSLDLLNLSQPLWSGLAKSLAWCGSLCAGEPHCVSLLFNNTEKSCKIFNMLHPLDDSTEEVEYYMIERASNRKLPESCVDLANCSGTSTDGEYWIYPKATSGQRLKVYCHNMGTNPTEYLTLKYTNTFVQHDGSNWIIQWKQCQSNYKTPLKQATFSKIAINIQITWSVVKGWMTAIRNLQRSVDGAEISFQCAGWCGKCGPSSEPIKLLLSSEIVADVEANAEVCTV